MGTIGGAERGTALVVAVIAMLVMGLLAVSLALLANLEATIGAAGLELARAEALAEAGLEHARDVLRSAAGEPCGFTRWTSPVALAGCGSPLGALVLSGVALGAGAYSAVVDNDCGPTLVPLTIQDPACAGANHARDGNRTAVLTAFATAGAGRARVRALARIDSVWRHVCAGHAADGAGTCRGGAGPTLLPADPGSPNGPRVFDDLPSPLLGCSRVDPTLHRRPGEPAALQLAACTAYPGMYAQPYPDHLARGTPRFVVMGADPAVVTGARVCDGGGLTYFGHFDCALTTPCPAALCGAVRQACVKPGDSRALSWPALYVETSGGVCPTVGGEPQTGLVFTAGLDVQGRDVGAPGAEVDLYVLNGRARLAGGAVRGTLVVEGSDDPATCPSDLDVDLGAGARIWSGSGGTPGVQYGFPLAALVYNPDLTPPTPDGTPQPTCARLGAAGAPGAEVHGLAYSGGHVESEGLTLDGGLVAFRVRASGPGSWVYGETYAGPEPIPGFAPASGDRVTLVRQSFARCATHADDSGGGTICP